jgi:hypothetical protein
LEQRFNGPPELRPAFNLPGNRALRDFRDLPGSEKQVVRYIYGLAHVDNNCSILLTWIIPIAACGRNQTPTRQTDAPRTPLGRMEVAQENNEEGRNAGRQEQ